MSCFSDKDTKDFGICPFLEATKVTMLLCYRGLYKKFGNSVYHASLSVIFPLSAPSRAMFVIAIWAGTEAVLSYRKMLQHGFYVIQDTHLFLPSAGL